MFKGRKIKKVIDKFEEVDIRDYTQAISELKKLGKSATQYVLKEFPQRKLDPEKVQLILDQLCDQSDVEELVSLLGDSFHEVRRVMKNILIIGVVVPLVPMILVSGVIFYQFHSSYKKEVHGHLKEVVQKANWVLIIS